jgi:hypothetical protein
MLTQFQLTTHLSIAVPHVVDNGLSIQPGYETFIKVTPDITTAEESVSKISLVNISGVGCPSFRVRTGNETPGPLFRFRFVSSFWEMKA